MNGKGHPSTIDELYYYIEGEFKILRNEIANMKKFTYWVAGTASAAAVSIFVGILKLLGN